MLFSLLYRPGGDDHLCVSRQFGSFEYLISYARRMLEWDAYATSAVSLARTGRARETAVR